MSSEFDDELQEMGLDIQEMRQDIRNLVDAVLELNTHDLISPELESMLKAVVRRNKPKKKKE